MTTRPGRLLTVTAVALALTGCAGGGDEEKAQGGLTASGTSASASASGTPSTEDPNAEAQAQEAAKAGVDPATPPKAIASATTAAVVEGDPKATMRVDLLRLKRQGKTVLASYAFTVKASESASQDPEWIYSYLGGQSWNPSLLDSTNLKLHRVVKADGRPLQTEYQGVKFRPGQTIYAYAVFAAPPEGVTTMDAIVTDGVPAVPGVPLS